MTDTFTTLFDKELVWTDDTGVTHLCEGALVHPGVRLIWTRCADGKPARGVVPGALDVPAGAAWLRRPIDWITCSACVDRKAAAEPKVLI